MVKISRKITLNKLEENLTFFNKMYDAVRIVDPLCKKVVEYQDSSIGQTDEICYDYWVDGNICDNCISVRAYRENKTFMKLEQTHNSIMLVTAMPIENAKEPTVLELIKNATDSMLVGTGDYNKGHMIKKVVDDFNQMIVKDPLTSIYNRRFIDERLPADIIKATIEEWPLSILFMDMDNLKYINDTYGHTIGDWVLKEMGNVIQSCIRDCNDWSARYGGDEFLVCLSNTNSDEAYRVAKRIRDNIEKIILPIEDKNARLTISIGIHTMKESEITADQIINQADKKMYIAKRRGKNNIVRDNIK